MHDAESISYIKPIYMATGKLIKTFIKLESNGMICSHDYHRICSEPMGSAVSHPPCDTHQTPHRNTA